MRGVRSGTGVLMGDASRLFYRMAMCLSDQARGASVDAR